MPAFLYEQALDPLREIEQYQSQHLRPGSYGATTNFIGTMRDFNAGDDVQLMTLEHYPEMTQKFLDRLCDEAMGKWSKTSILEAVRDPWLPLMYVGIFILLLGSTQMMIAGARKQIS